MKQVTLRDFLRNIKSFLPPPDSGLQVVRRDGPDFFIYSDVRQKPEQIERTSDIMSDIKQETSDVMGTSPENIKTMWCQLHFERGVTYECRLISWEDENGDVRVKEKWACPKCYDTYKFKDTGTFYDHSQI